MNNSLAVITTATDFNEGVFNFLDSCKYFGYHPLILGWGDTWKGNVHKAQLAGKAIKQLRDRYSLLLCLDSYDCIFCAPPEDLVRSFREMQHNMVFGSERFIWPDASKAEKHPEAPTPYRYLNGGGFIGDTWYVDQLFDYINFAQYHPEVNDQDVFQQFLIDNNHAIKLDYHCRIFQTMVLADDDIEYGDYIRNKLTGEYPKIIHGNGHWDMTKPVNWLQRKMSR